MKRTKLSRNSKLPIAKLKREADKWLSLWVRKNGSKRGMNECYTCRVWYLVEKLQCSHFFSRVHSATRFHPDNVRPACFACNVWRRGNIAAYSIRLQEEIGFERIKELERLSKSIFKLTPQYLQGIIDTYKSKYDNTQL